MQQIRLTRRLARLGTVLGPVASMGLARQPLAATIGFGTNCGSCVPELRALIGETLANTSPASGGT